MTAAPDPNTVSSTPQGVTDPSASPKAADPAAMWADYAKCAIIYPPGSERVAKAFAAFHAALEAAARRNRLVITMSQDHLHVDTEAREIAEGSKEAWLRDRLRSGALDGVVFHTKLTDESMLAFTKRLSEIHQRKGAVDKQGGLWPAGYVGIDLVHREFDGAFSAEDRAHLVHGTASDIDDGQDEALPYSDSDGLVDRLSSELQVTASVARISEQLAGLELPDEIQVEFGSRSVRRLLQYVVHCIPDDERKSYETASSQARSILGGLETMLQQEGRTTAAVTNDESVDLQALVYAASRMIFSRAPSEIREEDLPEREKGGHRGDDEISDDLSSLLLEINALPKQGISIDDENVDDHAEQLRVYFHYLARPAEGERLDTIYDQATRLLQECKDRERAAIREVLTEIWHRAEDIRGRRRVIEFFVHAKRTRLLRECGALPPDYVAQSFPRDFGIYLDGIDPTNAADRAELLGVVRSLDAARIQGCEAALVSGPESLAHPGRVDALLSLDSEATLPFVHCILALKDEELTPKIVRYLSKTGAGSEACVVLDVMGDLGRYAPHYLRDCARSLMAGTTYPGVLVYQADLLSGVVSARHSEPHQRIRAIHGLGALGTNDAKRRIQALLKRRFGLFPTEPSNIRQAARAALAAMEKQRV